MSVFEYDTPQRFIAGTVGEPGDRVFFLQATAGTRVTSVSLEKAQVAVLCERVSELLDEVLRRTDGAAAIPSATAEALSDNAPLTAPVEEDFRVGAMTLAWDGERSQVVIECLEVGAVPDEPSGSGLLRVRLSGAQARAFVRRAHAVVAAGRPPCPFCGNPLSLEGHVCPRANGHRR